MQYHRARWYDPAVGRFASLDPFSGNPRRPATLHKYVYAGDDPVNMVDPSGRFTMGAMISTLNGVISAALVNVGRGFALGASSGGVALRALGLAVEQSVYLILRKQLGKGAIERGITLYGPNGRRVLDFFIKAGERASYLEVKYGLPRKVGPAMTRLVGQMSLATTAAELNGAEVILFTWAAPSEAQMALLLANLGESASSVRIISGFVELSEYLRLLLLGI